MADFTAEGGRTTVTETVLVSGEVETEAAGAIFVTSLRMAARSSLVAVRVTFFASGGSNVGVVAVLVVDLVRPVTVVEGAEVEDFVLAAGSGELCAGRGDVLAGELTVAFAGETEDEAEVAEESVVTTCVADTVSEGIEIESEVAVLQLAVLTTEAGARARVPEVSRGGRVPCTVLVLPTVERPAVEVLPEKRNESLGVVARVELRPTALVKRDISSKFAVLTLSPPAKSSSRSISSSIAGF